MYAVYRQAHTPTAVEFSVYCNFISSKEKNLVVAGTSQLFVYRIIHDVEVISPAAKKRFIISLHCTKIKKIKIFCDMPCYVFLFRVPQNPTNQLVWMSITACNIHANLNNAFTLVSLLVFLLLQIPKPGRRSWSRWRPSPSLAMSCPWPACSWSAPVETPSCSVSKTPRYDRLPRGI